MMTAKFDTQDVIFNAKPDKKKLNVISLLTFKDTLCFSLCDDNYKRGVQVNIERDEAIKLAKTILLMFE